MLSCSVSVVLGTVAISLECRGLTTVQSLDFDCQSCVSLCMYTYLIYYVSNLFKTLTYS